MNRVQPDTSLQRSNHYKTYVALLTQADTAAPTTIELHNTVGDITWTRTAQGYYKATKIEPFPLEKTLIAPSGGGCCLNAFVNNEGDIVLMTIRPDNVTPSDDYLYNTPIEIRIYN